MKRWCTALLMWLGMVALPLIAISTSIEAGAPRAGPAAVKPTGELRIASAFLGAQRMIPWAEVPSGGIKQPSAAHLRHPGGLHRRWQDLCRERHRGTLGRSG